MECPFCGITCTDAGALERHANFCLDQDEVRNDPYRPTTLFQEEAATLSVGRPQRISTSVVPPVQLRKHSRKFPAMSNIFQRVRDHTHQCMALRQTRDSLVAVFSHNSSGILDASLVGVYDLALHEYMGLSPPASDGRQLRQQSSGASQSTMPTFTQVEASMIDKSVRIVLKWVFPVD